MTSPKTFRKVVLKPGVYRSPDGEVHNDPKRLQHWADTFQAMRNAGQVIPISWDHADTLEGVTPLSAEDFEKQRSAKNTIGNLASVELLNGGNDGAAFTVEVSDPVAQGRFERNEVFLSPVILDEWRDGHGNLYLDSITHVDAVNHPVDHSQGPFVPVNEPQAIACALRMGLGKIHKLSSEPAMDDDNKPADAPEENDTPVDNDAKLGEVLAALAGLDIVLGEDTTTANFLDRLHTGLLTAAAQRGETKPEDVAPVEEPAVAMMSAQGRTAFGYAARMHRESISDSLEALLTSGRCTPAEAKEKRSAIGAVKLSLDSNGQPASSSLEEWIASRQDVPKGTFWDADTKTRMSAEVIDPPSNKQESPTSEDDDAAVQFALTGKRS